MRRVSFSDLEMFDVGDEVLSSLSIEDLSSFFIKELDQDSDGESNYGIEEFDNDGDYNFVLSMMVIYVWIGVIRLSSV